MIKYTVTTANDRFYSKFSADRDWKPGPRVRTASILNAPKIIISTVLTRTQNIKNIKNTFKKKKKMGHADWVFDTRTLVPFISVRQPGMSSWRGVLLNFPSMFTAFPIRRLPKNKCKTHRCKMNRTRVLFQIEYSPEIRGRKKKHTCSYAFFQ